MGHRRKITLAFAIASLFVYSTAFTAFFAVPKLVILALGTAGAVGVVNLESKTVGAGLLFLSVAVLSSLFADDKWLALAGAHNNYSMGLLGLLIVFLYHISSGKPNCGAIGLAGALLGLHAFAQFAGLVHGYSIAGNRAVGTIGSPVDLGTVLAMCLPISASVSRVYAVAVVLGIIASGSRGAFLAGSAGMLAWGLA